MADQKQDKGATTSGNTTERSGNTGNTQDRSASNTPRATDQERDEERSGEPGAQYGTPSSMKEPTPRYQQGAHDPQSKNDDRSNTGNERDTERKDPSSTQAQGERKDGDKQGMRGEDRTNTPTGQTRTGKGEESNTPRAEREKH